MVVIEAFFLGPSALSRHLALKSDSKGLPPELELTLMSADRTGSPRPTNLLPAAFSSSDISGKHINVQHRRITEDQNQHDLLGCRVDAAS